MENKFKSMTNAELAAELKDRSMEHGGVISDILREASIRISVLEAGAKEYKRLLEDDGK